MATLFFSYSHEDQSLRDQLEIHLAALKREGLLEAWHDRMIPAGNALDGSISAELDRADIVLLLVSPNFIASSYCYDVEMARALDRQKAGHTHVVPVILRHCDWKKLPFGGLKAVPRDGKPVRAWPDIDEALTDVVREIRRLVEESGKTLGRPRSTASKLSEPASPSIRSSNLRIKKEFTDQDRDDFLHSSFEYMASFFENSMQEIERRESSISGRYRRIDANRFSATLYRGGKERAACVISLGAKRPFGDGITYSRDESGGVNEMLRVETGDQSLALSPWAASSSFGAGSRDQKLTAQGGAELFWTNFVEPLQRS